MRIGYACITLGLPGTGLKTCTQKNASLERLRELTAHNLERLEQQVDYNLCHGIRLFRISSDLIPFGSSPVNTLIWWEEFKPQFDRIAAKIAAGGLRVSMHPGQYTVLNSPDAGVVSRAIDDLAYHARILDALGQGADGKIILHIGGVYNDKPATMERFEFTYRSLPDNIRKRLVIENDERCYNIADVLKLGEKLGIPVVYDNLHNQVYPADSGKTDADWIRAAAGTWGERDGNPKVHYSQQDHSKKHGAHAQTIALPKFLQFVAGLSDPLPDIMLEVKDKDLSATKCILATAPPQISRLEEEWARYKYAVMEHDNDAYHQIQDMLKDKSSYPVEAFYELVHRALQKPVSKGGFENAAQHVWGHFKREATEAERKNFGRALERYRTSSASGDSVKNILWSLAQRCCEPYLQKIYTSYFHSGTRSIQALYL